MLPGLVVLLSCSLWYVLICSCSLEHACRGTGEKAGEVSEDAETCGRQLDQLGWTVGGERNGR